MSSSRRSRSHDPNETRIYVGNLPRDVRVRDLQALFDTFGKIVFIDLKTKYSVPFAFIDYDDPRDARDAVRKRHNYDMDGYPLIVEQPRGKAYQDRERERDRYGGGYGSSRRGYGGYGRAVHGRSNYDDRRRGSYRGRFNDDEGSPKPRFTAGYHVRITGLPSSTSWQDLKDLMRDAGEVGYTDIKGDTAIVQFHRYDDMKYAIKKFDDYEFTSAKGDRAVIRVREAETNKRRSRSASASRSRSRSPRRRSRRDSRSASRSASKSPKRSISPNERSSGRGRSISRSRSRSVSPRD